jgi:hypothetical protein
VYELGSFVLKTEAVVRNSRTRTDEKIQADVRFYAKTATSRGGFEVSNPAGAVVAYGYDAQVFTGDRSNPTFNVGTFNLYDIAGPELSRPHQLTISEVIQPKPLEYKFTLSGPNHASFVLPASPKDFSFDASSFEVVTQVRFNDETIRPYIGFFDQTVFHGGGGLRIQTDTQVLSFLYGPDLFTGPVYAPTFKLGAFRLHEFGSGNTYQINITTVAGAVPEPASWGLMVAGFGLAGGAVRRQRRMTVAGASA